jgi:WD40 repeat protein
MLHCRWVLPACWFLVLAFVADAQPIQPAAKDIHDAPLPAGAVARLSLARGQHGISPIFLRFLPDGRGVIRVNDDLTNSLRILRVWELPSGKEMWRIDLPLPGPSEFSPQSAGLAALSKDGKIIASRIPGDGEVHLLEAATGKQLPGLKLTALKSGGGLAFSPDGIHLATGEADGTIRIWDWANAKLVHSFGEGSHGVGGFPVRVAFGRDGKRLAGSSNILLAYARDGKAIASGPFQQKDKTCALKVWDPATGAALCTIPAASEFLEALVFSPDGKALAACGDGNTFVLWDATTGQRLGPLPERDVTFVAEPKFQIIHANGNAAFSPDGRSLAVDLSDGTGGLYEVATGQRRGTFGQKVESAQNRTRFAFSSDGNTLARAGGSHVVYLYDVQTVQELAALDGHLDAVNAVAFAPDAKTLASASADNTVLIWDVTKITRLAAIRALEPGELEERWQTLAGNDAAKAFKAIHDLAAAPKEAVPWIKEQLKPAKPFDQKRTLELLKNLDSEEFKTRDSATKELLKLDEQIVPALDKALAANPSLESKRRLEGVRDKLTAIVLQGERLRDYRAIEVLERIGTPEARQVLQELAKGAPGALITSSAQAALKR